jgi:hypothetical protein
MELSQYRILFPAAMFRRDLAHRRLARLPQHHGAFPSKILCQLVQPGVRDVIRVAAVVYLVSLPRTGPLQQRRRAIQRA